MNYLKTLILLMLLKNMLECMTSISVGAPEVWKVQFLWTLCFITLYELLQDKIIKRTISVE
jgi:hypothetical protein